MKINKNTKRLLKGFYTANKNELEGEKDDAADQFGFNVDNGKIFSIMK